LDTKSISYSLHCDDCGEKWFAYMLKDSVWEAVFDDFFAGDYCLPCFEERLGRPLTHEDFMNDIPLNDKFHDNLIDNFLCN
jgi:hypothetical protein